MEELILLSEYCEKSRAELEFILRLESEGLIETEIRDDAKYLQSEQLSDLDMFTRLHYDLSINIEGIDVIQRLLNRLHSLERELNILRRQLNADMDSFFDDNFLDEI